MGIDKPNVRLVVHMDMPQSIEAYYQEAGRAGRDGVNSYAIVLYNTNDIQNLQERIDQLPDAAYIKKCYEHLCNTLRIALGDGKDESFQFDFQSFIKQRKLDVYKTLAAFKVLEHEGWIHWSNQGSLQSKLQFLVSSESLLHQGGKTDLIKTILRSYSGITDHLVNIDERLIAKRSSLTKEKVIQILKSLHKQEVVNYIEKSNDQKIDWLHNRLDFHYFNISKESIERIQHIWTNQIRKSQEYLTGLECRNTFLLKYFGEEAKEACGVCDICRERGTKKSSSNYKSIEKGIITVTEERIEFNQILVELKDFRSEDVIGTLRQMLDEGLIHKDDNNIYYRISR